MLDRLRRSVPIRITVIAACNRRIWPASLHGITEAWHSQPCDVGVVQSDDVTVDLAATGRCLQRWLEELPSTVQREQDRLASRFDLVLGDVPSPAFDAAHHAGIRSVALANFTWDWIYAELGFAEAASAAAGAYAKATVLLESTPSAPMQAFRERIGVGLIAREPSRARAAARTVLGLQAGETAVLLAFQPAFARAVVLPRRRQGRRYLAPPGWPDAVSRGDVRVLAEGREFEDALAAADVVVGKPGYGLIGDVEAAGARFLFVPRPGFPENSVLERYLRERAGTASLPATALSAGTWEDALDAIAGRPRPPAAEAGGALRAAHAIEEILGAAGDASVDSGASAE